MQYRTSLFFNRAFASLCLVVLLQWLLASSAFSQGVGFPSREQSTLITPSMLSPTGPNVFYVQNDARSSMFSSSFANQVKYKSNQTFVRFAINHDFATITLPAYTYKLVYKLEGSRNMADSTPNFTATDTLTVSYNLDSLSSFQDVQWHNYAGLYNAKLTVLQLYDITSGTPVPLSFPTTVQNYTIELAMQYQPYVKTHYLPSDMTLRVTNAYDPSSQQLTVSWTPMSAPLLGKVMPATYELEWTYVDDYSGDLNVSLGPGQLNYTFKNNATRVLTDSSNYAIPIIYPRGYVLYRVRMVRVDSTLYKTPIYGVWNGAAASGTVSANSGYAYYSTGHWKDTINWNYTISFGEGGKYKHVLGYFDGMLKNRQTITRFNSNPGLMLVTENIYDYEGRPSIVTLPSVVTSKLFQYQKGVSTSSITLKPYGPGDFDKRLYSCPAEMIVPPFTSDALANKYYSTLNTDTGGMQKFVPRANGYPFVHTRLSAGFADRIDKQGGAGDKLQIGMGHETINEYTDADQTDLNRLFGVNAGFKNFYHKTVTTDPNGQLSMLVKDYQGKQIATSLIGASVDTAVTAIMFNDEVPNAAKARENVLSNASQLTTGHQRIFNGNFYMDYAAHVQVEYDYTFTPYMVCPAPNYLGLTVKGAYDYTVTDDCGIQRMHHDGVLGQTGVVTSSNQSPVIAIADTTLDKGKYTIDKTLSIATDEIYAAVDSFFAHKPNCAKTEDDFIKQEVESRQFPCPGNPNDPCAALAKKMMEELFPNAKYGNYVNNNGVITTSGNPASIFDRIKKHTTTGADSSYFRYQSPCDTAELNAISINVFGHTYINLGKLPVDSFIYVYNYAGANRYKIAHALLPLHPEYCQLLGCFIDTFETRLKSIPDAMIAQKYGLFSLDSIVQKDTLLRYKMLQVPINMTHIADSLKLMLQGTVRMDTLASELAFCLSDDTLVYGGAKKIFHNQIVNLQFPSTSVANYYFDKLRGLYLANREKYKTIAQTGGGNSCGPCQDDRMTLSPPPLVTVTYNNNGSFNTGPTGLLGLFSSNMQGAIAAVMNGSGATYTSQDSINKYQDSSAKFVHQADSTLSYIAIDSIMGRLVNCITNPTQQTALKAALTALYLNGIVHNGVFLPEQVRAAIVSAGIALSDLCHPYLVSYDYYDDGMGQKGGCQSDTWYNSVAHFFSTGDINDHLKAIETYPQVYSLSWNPTGDLFAEQIDGTLQGSGPMNMMTVYNPANKVYQLAFFRTGGADSIIFSMRSPGDVTVPGVTGSFPLFKTTAGGSLAFTNISCFFQDPTAFADGHIGRFLFRANVSRTDMYGTNQFQTTQSQMLGWNNGRILMNTIGGNEIAGCIPATQFRAAFKGFADSMQTYNGYKADHPLFFKSLRNYMNYNLKKIFTEDQYQRFLNSCALSDSMNIPMCGGYAQVTLGNGVTFAAIRQIINADFGFTIKALLDYTFPGYEIAIIDYRTVPYALLAKFNATLPYYPGMASCKINTILANVGALWLPVSPDGSTPLNKVLAGTTFTTPDTAVVSLIRGNNHYNYIGYDIGASGLTNSQLTAAINTVQQNIYNNNILAYWLPSSYAAVNADYNKPEKKQLLNYTYAMQSLTPAKVLDSLQDFYLHGNVPAFASGDVSYNDPANPNRFTNLYYTDPSSVYPGDSVLNKMLGWAKTKLGSNKLFISPNSNAVPANGVPSPGYMNMYRCSDGLYWYRYFDDYNKLYNVYVRVPQYVYDNVVPNLTVAAIAPSNGDSATRRFKLTLLNGQDTVYADGSTDFDIAWSRKLSDVLLGNEDTHTEADPVSGVVGAPNNCEQQLLTTAILAGKMDYVHYIDSFRTALKAAFYAHVMGQLNEKLWIEYIDKRFATTLYNYDLAGNLTQTIPPMGVHKLDSVSASRVDSFRLNRLYPASGIPKHQKMTQYEYNTVNKPTLESTPDAGDKMIYYDSKGNVILSQNAKQRPKGLFTYMLYDGQNRVTETGEVQWGDCPAFADMPLYRDSSGIKVRTPKPSACAYPNLIDSLWEYNIPGTFSTMADQGNTLFARQIRAKARTQVVATVYDAPIKDLSAIAGMNGQENLRSRIAANMYFENCAANSPNNPDAQPTTGYVHATHYSYDEQGNVKTIVQEIPELVAVGLQYKRVDYEYDLLSGKVDMISYDRGFGDQFYQRYSYDADNRITKVETSHDGFIWKRDADYTYYQHGPLARVSLGDQRVQGIDYAYTLQGWLKSINADYIDTAQDAGGDGRAGMVTPTDVFATGINYFAGDYQPIGQTPLSYLPQQTKNLYNGNIARQTNGVAKFGPLTTQYTYDQLNRLRKATNGTLQNNVLTFNNWYASSYKYDMDGNITNLVRRIGDGTRMDTISYVYGNSANNKLTHVIDRSGFSQAGIQDIPAYTSLPGGDNFFYDENGNLIKDYTSATDTVLWNIYGKATDINNNGIHQGLHMLYDGSGQRIAKKQKLTTDTGYVENSTYYLRDAQGNILAEYNGTIDYRKGDVRPLLTDLLSQVPADSQTRVWLQGINLSGYMQQPALASYITGLGGNIPVRPAGYYLQQYVDNNTFTQDYNLIQSIAGWSGRHPETPVIGDAMLVFLDYCDPGYAFAAITHDILGHPSAEKGTKAMRVLIRDMPALLPQVGIGLPVTDTAATAQKMYSDNLANNKLYSGLLLNGWRQETLPYDQYRQWFADIGSDSTIYDPADNWYRGSNWANIMLNYMQSYGDLAAWFMSPDIGTPIEEYGTVAVHLQQQGNGKPMAECNIYAFANDWPGSFARLEALHINYGPTAFNMDPVPYCTALQQRLGSLDFSIDALLKIPWQSFDPQVLAANTGTRIRDPFITTAAPILKKRTMSLTSHHIYGSSRLGIAQYWPLQYGNGWDYTSGTYDTLRLNQTAPWYSTQYNDVVTTGKTSAYGNGLMATSLAQNLLGQKQYELTNHLGNVMATVSDKRYSKDLNSDGLIDGFRAEIRAAYDYYPYGMLMPGRWVQDTARHCMLVSQTQNVTTTVINTPPWWNDWSRVPTWPGTGFSFSQSGDGIRFTISGTNAWTKVPFTVAAGSGKFSFDVSSMYYAPLRMTITETVDGNDVQLASSVLSKTGNYSFDLSSETGNITLNFTDDVPHVQPVDNSLPWIIFGSPHWQTTVTTPQTTVVQICNGGKDAYEFGFNGQMKTNEIAGTGNWYTAEHWEYNPRLARRMNPDPVRKPWESSYATFSSNPIIYSDVLGDNARVEKKPNDNGKGGEITISTKIHVKGGSEDERKSFIANAEGQKDFMKKSGLMDGVYKDESGNEWKIHLNIEYVDGEDKNTKFEEGDNTMELSNLHDKNYNRSQVYQKDVQEVVKENGKYRPTGKYIDVNIAGDKGAMRGNLDGYTIYHESMHFLGLSDRYEEDGTKHPGYQQDIMSCGGYKFNQNHWNNWGKAILGQPNNSFILTHRVDIQGTERKLMLPEGYETKKGTR